MPASEAEDRLDRVDELLSLYLDDDLTPTQAKELNDLLLADPSARTRCVDMAMLHADLVALYAEQRGGSTAAAVSVALPKGLGASDVPAF